MTLAPAPALAVDPDVPQRDELLDAEAVGERLARLLGDGHAVAVSDCRRVYARYRPGHRLRVLYHLEVDGEPHRVAATTYRGHERCRTAFARAERASVPAGLLRSVVRDETLDTIFWTFPNDQKIASLSSLADGSPILARLLDRPVTPQLVSYAPGKTATAACVDRRGRAVAYARVYGDTVGQRTQRVQRALAELLGADDPGLRLPGVLLWAADERTLVTEAVRGDRLSELRGVALADAVRRLGAALARLHRLRPRVPLPVADTGLRTRLLESADAIARTRPDAAAEASALLHDLLARWPASVVQPAFVHGDAALHNARLEDGRVVLLDLDDAELGPAAADLGRVLALLRARERLGRLERGGADTLSGDLIRGYGEAGRLPPPAELRWHVAASLLVTRAGRAVTSLNPGWAAELHGLLHDARELVG